jgi:hypothetical protein
MDTVKHYSTIALPCDQYKLLTGGGGGVPVLQTGMRNQHYPDYETELTWTASRTCLLDRTRKTMMVHGQQWARRARTQQVETDSLPVNTIHSVHWVGVTVQNIPIFQLSTRVATTSQL